MMSVPHRSVSIDGSHNRAFMSNNFDRIDLSKSSNDCERLIRNEDIGSRVAARKVAKGHTNTRSRNVVEMSMPSYSPLGL